LVSIKRILWRPLPAAWQPVAVTTWHAATRSQDWAWRTSAAARTPHGRGAASHRVLNRARRRPATAIRRNSRPRNGLPLIISLSDSLVGCSADPQSRHPLHPCCCLMIVVLLTLAGASSSKSASRRLNNAGDACRRRDLLCPPDRPRRHRTQPAVRNSAGSGRATGQWCRARASGGICGSYVPGAPGGSLAAVLGASAASRSWRQGCTWTAPVLDHAR
jgi:hypothetical protein